MQLLKREKIWTNKNLGQNFLINPTILDEIISAADLTNQDYIMEVGPGLGVLTEKLLEHAKTVHSIELDQQLIPYLKRTFSNNKTFELEEGTALKARLPDHPYKLVANIPYYITSPLLRHFLNPKDPAQLRPELIVLLVQKEVAQKICADANDQSILSLNVQIFGKPQIIQTVAPAIFFPIPKVDSAILKIEVYKEPLITNLKLFSQITRIAFAQRRKTLGNTIKNFTRQNREETEALLKSINIDPSQRPQTLSIQQWQTLIDKLI